jgi:hypothetical protein
MNVCLGRDVDAMNQTLRFSRRTLISKALRIGYGFPVLAALASATGCTRTTNTGDAVADSRVDPGTPTASAAGAGPIVPAAATQTNIEDGCFADDAFMRLWAMTDATPGARPYVWGPTPFTGGLFEDFQEAPNGGRLVQYFDKARMELTTPGGSVTAGSLPVGLITGKQQFLRAVTVDASDTLVAGPVDLAPNTDINTDIQMGPDGDLWLAAPFTQELHRIVYNGNAPVAKATTDVARGAPPLTVHLSAAGSTDPGGGTLSYSWDLGDGTDSTEANPVHTYTNQPAQCPNPVICTYTPTVTVTSSATGLKGTTGVNVTVTAYQPPTATIDAPVGSLTYKVGDTINFSGHAVDPQDGALPAAVLNWQVLVHHCPGGNCHLHYLTAPTGVAGGSFTIPDHGDDTYFEIVLTAQDSAGLTDTKSVTIHPQTTAVTLATAPTGLQVVYDGTAHATPYTAQSVVGSRHTLTAPTPQGGEAFGSWSDGGAAQHDITVGTSPVTYIVSYKAPPPPGPLPAPQPAGTTTGTRPAPLPARSVAPPGPTGAGTPPAPLPPLR